MTLLAGTALGSVACVSGDGEEVEVGGTAAATATALRVYDHFQTAAEDKVKFSLTGMRSGNLTELSERSINDLLEVPNYWLTSQHIATEISNVAVAPRDAAQDEWKETISVRGFEEDGRKLDEGTFQILDVRMTVGGEVMHHRALEACWAKDNFCHILDPVVLDLSTFASNRENLLNQNWQPVLEEVPELPDEDLIDRASGKKCQILSGEPGKKVWGARHEEQRGLFGSTAASADLGRQEVGVTCYVSSAGKCIPSPFGDADASSCRAHGFATYNQCECKKTGALKKKFGNSASVTAITRCAAGDKGDFQFKMSYKEVSGGFDVDWDIKSRTQWSNGGEITRSCGFK